MLENIRSRYILKNILFYISEKKKLNLFRYNKNIQAKLNIKILNYKIISGNYTTIYEDNKNKKYLTNTMMNYFLKENFQMDVKTEKEKNIMIMIN